MSSVQRRIRQIHPARHEPLEEQFWPVAIALLITGGLAVGAISAVLRGPWLWGSLILLPVLVVAAFLALRRLRKGWVRRSMQLGILVSAAVHLLAIMLSAFIDIFGGTVHRPVVHREPNQPSPTLIVSQRDPQPIWEQLNQREITDPVDESERLPTVTEAPRHPQSIELPQHRPTPTPQPLERRNPAPSVPRQDVSLSQRGRSQPEQPSPTATSVATSRPETPEISLQVHETSMPRATDSTVAKVSPTAPPLPTSPSSQAAKNSSQRRESPSEHVATSEPSLSARMRHHQTALPQAGAATSPVAPSMNRVAESSPAPQTREIPAKRAEISAPATRSDTWNQASELQRSRETLKPRENLRTETPPLPPTWSQVNATAREPRQIALPSDSTASPQPEPRPAVPATVQQPVPARDLAATSDTRGDAGGSNARQFENIHPRLTPSTGLAAAPADAIHQRRAENRVDPQPTLTAAVQPQTRGRQTGTQAPQSAWQANASHPATLSAQTTIAPKTTEAAAANNDSAANRTAADRVGEQGESTMDIGPTKLVADQAAQRQSGGGQPTPTQLDVHLPQLAARSASGHRPTLPTQATGAAQTPLASPSAPPETVEMQPGGRDLVDRAEGGEQRDSGAPAIDTANDYYSGSNTFDMLNEQTSANRRPAERERPGVGASITAEESTGGSDPNRVSRAPRTASPTAAPATASQGLAHGESTPSLDEVRPSASSASSREAKRAAHDLANTSLPVELPAELGPAGLTAVPRPGPGTLARPASREVLDAVLDADARFRRRDAGATPSASADANVANEAFRSRREQKSASGPSTEAAIELGLEFLARYQHADGRWSLNDFDRDDPRHAQIMSSDMAATGLAVLAFQGAGYTHRDYKYAPQLSRAIQWIISQQGPDGRLFVEHEPMKNDPRLLYSHAIATLALTEAYGMTQDPNLRKPIERALQFIARTQDPQRGGWRYRIEPADRRTDTSVTGWMMMALQSARLADIPVSQEVWNGIQQWLNMARDEKREFLFRYDPFADPAQAQHRTASPSMTSVGLLMRLYAGWDRRDRRLIAGGEYLLNHPPGERSPTERDTYYWYYATQVLRHLGGETWEEWNRQLHPLLVDSQVKSGDLAGSWDPYHPVPDRWAHAAGRLYVTTMNLLSLEVNYRLLPLYEKSTE